MKLKTVFRIIYIFEYKNQQNIRKEDTLTSINYDEYPDDKVINKFIEECLSMYKDIIYGEISVQKIIITAK